MMDVLFFSDNAFVELKKKISEIMGINGSDDVPL